MNCAGEKDSGGHYDPAATGFIASVDGFAQCIGGIGLSVSDGAVAVDVEIARGEFWRLDAGQDRWDRAPINHWLF